MGHDKNKQGWRGGKSCRRKFSLLHVALSVKDTKASIKENKKAAAAGYEQTYPTTPQSESLASFHWLHFWKQQRGEMLFGAKEQIKEQRF